MSKMDRKTAKNTIEADLNFLYLLETTYCLLKAYIIWIYVKIIQITKFDVFINFVQVFICNVKAKINNSKSQRKNLLQWIRSKVKEQYYPTNYRDDWKDGIILCALIDGVVPGSCPRYDLLNRDNAIENLNLGLFLVKKHLNIDSPITSHEISLGSEEAKLVYLLSRIKFESIKLLMKSLLKRPIIQVKDSSGNSQRVFESLFGDEKTCFAKGMGLILGVRTRRSRFNIFCKPTPKLNLMIEINGPNNTMCSQRIAVHNPKKRFSADVVTSSLVSHYLNRKTTSEEILKIPFFYEVFSNRIAITYIPLMVGIHKLSIIWQGQHILNSPYTVKVEECSVNYFKEPENIFNVTNATKFVPGLQYPVNALTRRDSFSFEESATVVDRKVRKQMVVINGKQEVINDYNKDVINKSNDFNKCFDNSLDKKMIEEINVLENCEKLNISTIGSHSRRIDKLVINKLNKNTELLDIKECDSIHSELHSNGSKSRQDTLCSQDMTDSDNNKKTNINENENGQFLNAGKTSANAINNSKENSPNLSSNKKLSIKPSIDLSRNIINNCYYRSYIPVKNMIQNWETKLLKNVNQTNEIRSKDQNKFQSKIPYIPVRNKCKIFEKPITSVLNTNLNTNQFRLDSTPEQDKQILNNSVSDKAQIGPIYYINQNNKNTPKYGTIESELTQPFEADIKTPESQPDSGICNNLFADFNLDLLNQNNLRLKSLSYPNLRTVDSNCLNQIETKNEDNEQYNSSSSGQYIDDEIPDYSNLFLGQYVSYSGLLNIDRPVTYEDINFDNLFDWNENNFNVSKNQKSTQDLGIYPEKCEIFGAGAYYGQVDVKNHFVVSTKNGGKSYLSIGVQSAEEDAVIEVSFRLIGQNRYEVQYVVNRPGYYVIFVKWGDYNIADSPFICKVTL